MFKQRLITGLLLAVAAYYIITISSLTAFLCVEAAILLFASLEWSRLIGFDSTIQKLQMIMILLVGVALLGYMPFYLFNIIVIIWWILCACAVIAYQRGKIIWPDSPILLSLVGTLFLAPLLISAYNFKHLDEVYDLHALLFVVIIIALCDIMAYFVGKTFGNHLLISRVSPKKTWEGIIGGIIASGLLSVPIGFWCKVSVTFNPWIILPSVIIVSVSIVGDLAESVCKRNAGVKDSGQILPGHGGILDRFDSYMAGVPIAYILFQFIK